MEIVAGMAVRSKAGRDSGSWFIVLRCEGEFAYIANGELRKVDHPKKKKLRHLQASGYVSAFVANKLENGLKVTNQEVRTALAEFLSK